MTDKLTRQMDLSTILAQEALKGRILNVMEHFHRRKVKDVEIGALRWQVLQHDGLFRAWEALYDDALRQLVDEEVLGHYYRTAIVKDSDDRVPQHLYYKTGKQMTDDQ